MQGYTTVGILHTVLTLYPIGGGGGQGSKKISGPTRPVGQVV